MTTHKSYAECKIAHPDSEIVTPSIDSSMPCSMDPIFEVKANHEIGKFAWVICNPADYCSSLEDYFDAGFELVRGDWVVTPNGIADNVRSVSAMNGRDFNDGKRYILSVAALNGGCKIPAKPEQWSIYNNMLSLCELTDEERGLLFNHHCNGGCIQSSQRGGNEEGVFYDIDSWSIWSLNTIYRAKPKSERELFIEAAVSTFDGRTGLSEQAMSLAAQLMFDSGKFKRVIKDGE